MLRKNAKQLTSIELMAKVVLSKEAYQSDLGLVRVSLGKCHVVLWNLSGVRSGVYSLAISALNFIEDVSKRFATISRNVEELKKMKCIATEIDTLQRDGWCRSERGRGGEERRVREKRGDA
eukprot:scaffold344_cov132-Skeletonema_menzelii.AAC.1